MAGRDITDGRANRSIAVDVGIVSTSSYWTNTDVSYDVAIGGQPFLYAINDARPYIRETAPFKKDQFDNQQEPGEQSLTGWWIRSQSSFHSGTGIKFYDPSSGETVAHRFAESKGINPWVRGQVTLLKSCVSGHITTGPIADNKRPNQFLRSITWGTNSGVLLLDEYDMDKINSDGTVTHFVDYNNGTDSKVFAMCDDGTTAYWITNNTSGGAKLEMLKKDLTLDSTTAGSSMFTSPGTVVTNAVIDFVKERIVACINNKVYELNGSSGSLGTAVYTHPSTSHIYTSITASGTAIYISGYNGIQSTIQKFTLGSNGTMPTLTQAVVAAELPVGEIVYKIFYYLGYMMIGTSKGIRAATVESDGSISYGPLIVNTVHPCYDFAAYDHYIWCATSIDGVNPGTVRIDLGNEIEPLRFAYANDVYADTERNHITTACAFLDSTNRLAFTSASLNAGVEGSGLVVTNKQLTSNVATLTLSGNHGLVVGDIVWVQGVGSPFDSSSGTYTITAKTDTTISYAKTNANIASTAVSSSTARVELPGNIWIESANDLIPSGYIKSGNIRYNTLEKKHFERMIARGEFNYGSMVLETVDPRGNEYDHITYEAGFEPVEVTTEPPYEAEEYVAVKFILNRDATDISKGPVFKGYQLKALIATQRHRVLQFPMYCFDVETDRYNTIVGYEGRAYDRLQALETIEESGDVVTWQDLTTGETHQAVIEKISFTRMTPPDKRFSGFGGIITIQVRTL